MRARALAGMVLLGMVTAACESPYQQGVQRVTVPGGTNVYFKRETAGFNSDQLGLTTDGNPCHRLDESKDYVYPELGPLEVYFAIQQGTITIYSSSELRKPATNTFPLRVNSVVLSPLDFQEMERSYRSRGLTKVSVEASRDNC